MSPSNTPAQGHHQRPGLGSGTRTYLRPEGNGGPAPATEVQPRQRSPARPGRTAGRPWPERAESCPAEALREVQGHPLSLVWEACGPTLARSPHKPRGLYLEGRLRLLHSAHPTQGACQPHLGRGQLQPFAMLSLLLDAKGSDSPREEGKAAWGMTAPRYLPPLPTLPGFGSPLPGQPDATCGQASAGKLVSAARVSSQEA